MFRHAPPSTRPSRRGSFAALALLAAAGCESDPRPAPAASQGSTTAPLSSGTRVIAAVAEVSFREGEVVSSDGERVTIAFDEAADAGPRPTQTVGREAVWPRVTPDAHRTAVRAAKPGVQTAICELELTARDQRDPRWHPCEITGGASGKLRVRDVEGRRHTLEPSRVVIPDASRRRAIADHLVRARRHRTFDEGFDKAGRPFTPPSWRPAPGDEVVIHLVGPSWYGGQVVEHHGDLGKVRVRYDGDVSEDRDVALAEVAPVPSADRPVPSTAIVAGSYALRRAEAPTDRWAPVRVKRVDGARVVVADRDDAEQAVPRGDLLPLVPSPRR